MWLIPVVCKYVQCQSIILDLSWGLSLIIIINYVVSFFCMSFTYDLYMKMSFSVRQISETLGKNRGFQNARFWIWKSLTADFDRQMGSNTSQLQLYNPLARSPLWPFHSQWLTGGTPDVIWMNMRKTRGFPTMLSEAPRTSNGQDFKAQQNIETIADVLWSFGSRDTSFGTGKLYLITNCLVNHRCRTVTFQID